MPPFKGERISKNTKTQNIFNYIDEEKKINTISRIEFIKKDEVIHYPRGFEGKEKYNTIKTFVFKGFKGKLPVGVYKSANFGWGFTKPFYPFADFINKNYEFTQVVIEKGGKIEIDAENQKLFLNETALEAMNSAFTILAKKYRGEVNYTLLTHLNLLFPSLIEKPVTTYTSNALASSLAAWGNSIGEFSDDDKNAIRDLFEKLSIGTDFLTDQSLSRTKEIIDTKYIRSALSKYERLLKLNNDGESLEKQWQLFLKENSWIFSSIFAYPVILFKREAYVGGKTVDNQNGKFSDFLIKNHLSGNVSFLEIKTHKTKILEKVAYRGEDVFGASKDLTGSIAQVLNQRDNFQKEFYSIKGKEKGPAKFESLNSRCVVLIGSINSLSDNQKLSFELFRSNSRDVEILTFDELQYKIQSLQKLMSKK